MDPLSRPGCQHQRRRSIKQSGAADTACPGAGSSICSCTGTAPPVCDHGAAGHLPCGKHLLPCLSAAVALCCTSHHLCLILASCASAFGTNHMVPALLLCVLFWLLVRTAVLCCHRAPHQMRQQGPGPPHANRAPLCLPHLPVPMRHVSVLAGSSGGS